MVKARSYTDPFYDDLDAKTAAEVGLPPGLLQSIRTKGERSNSDQVSEAGAKTVYQITPTTRKLILDKYGIDPYLSEENASKGAALLLKEGMQRNNGNPLLATAEYIGGTNRKNWGPVTKAYVRRVSQGLGQYAPSQAAAQPAAEAPAEATSASPPGEAEFAAAAQVPGFPTTSGAPVQSTFERVKAETAPKTPTEGQMANVFKAYQEGKMSPEDASAFEADVQAGKIMLPKGGALKGAAAAPSGPMVLPPGVVAAYVNNKMTPDERAELEADVRAGRVKMPETTAASASVIPGTQVVMPPGPEAQPTIAERAIGTGEAALGAGTAATTGQIGMIGGMLKGMAEQILSGQYGTPEAARLVEQSAQKGMQAFTYAPRTEQGREQLAAVGEAAQVIPPVIPTTGPIGAIGESVAAASQMAAARRGAAAAQRAEAAIPAATQAAATEAAPIAAAASPAAATAAPVAAAVERSAPVMPAAELAQTAKKAAEGSKKATAILAEQAAPDAKTIEAAKRLGVEEFLQPDHVTTNQSYRELAQAVKSMPGSEARRVELEGLQGVAKRADDLIAELGGTEDLSAVNQRIKQSMGKTVEELSKKADDMYALMREKIPAKAAAPATSTLEFIGQRAQNLGGKGNLSPTEKMILGKLSPKNGKEPTYTLLDDVRRDLTAARVKGAGPFKDADTGLLKKLESELLNDQKQVVDAHGMSDVFNEARRIVAVRKGIEDDMAAILGKNLDGSIVGDLSSAMKSLPAGNVEKFINLVKAVPEDMRQQTVASGLSTAFGKSARNGKLDFNSYARWYEGVLKNKRAHAALMANLPPEARKQLSDLYRVSRGIGAATKERITTGRIQAVSEELRGADSLMGRIYDVAKRSGGAVAAEAATSAVGLPGAGLASGLTAAFMKGKPDAIKAADALISSPEFIAASRASKATPAKAAAIKNLATSSAFNRFSKAVGQFKGVSERQAFIAEALGKSAGETATIERE